MGLFSKEKGVVLNILNAVLIIWLMIGIVATISNIVDYVFKDPVHTYEEYEAVYCYDYGVEEDKDYDKSCNNDFVSYKYDIKYRNNEIKKGFVLSISNILLSGIVLIILNRKKSKK